MEQMMDASPQTLKKLEDLRTCIEKMGSVAVAFSGGVDSTLLIKVTHDVLGDRAVAVTASSGAVPERELKEAVEFCKKEGIRQIIMKADDLQKESFLKNPPDRCYHCKKAIFTKVKEVAKAEGLAFVAEGSNLDDDSDYRPGHRAIVELQVRSPLKECQLMKMEIRQISKYLGLPTWEKQSYACLASRFVYGDAITPEKLAMVDQGEQLLLDLGFRQMRVRIHDGIARIEIWQEEFPRLMEHREQIVKRFKEIGFTYVTMDLQGYRTGSMNESLGR